MEMLKCKRCNYEWLPRPRYEGEKPKQCPRCKQLTWEHGLQPRVKREYCSLTGREMSTELKAEFTYPIKE
jgi:hypothetical protein